MIIAIAAAIAIGVLRCVSHLSARQESSPRYAASAIGVLRCAALYEWRAGIGQLFDTGRCSR